MRPFASKASAVSLPPLPLRLLLAGATVARWELHPLKNDAFARRTVIPFCATWHLLGKPVIRTSRTFRSSLLHTRNGAMQYSGQELWMARSDPGDVALVPPRQGGNADGGAVTQGGARLALGFDVERLQR
jgi:hypothetical protein